MCFFSFPSELIVVGHVPSTSSFSQTSTPERSCRLLRENSFLNWSKCEKSLDQKKSDVKHVVKRSQRDDGRGARSRQRASETSGNFCHEKWNSSDDGLLDRSTDCTDDYLIARKEKEKALAAWSTANSSIANIIVMMKRLCADALPMRK
jgi:hypothetical protein